MLKYRIIVLDVWGNEEEGWEVNQWFYTNTYIDIRKDWDNEDLLKELKGACLLRECVTVEMIAIEDGVGRVFIESASTGEPLYWLEEVEA